VFGTFKTSATNTRNDVFGNMQNRTYVQLTISLNKVLQVSGECCPELVVWSNYQLLNCCVQAHTWPDSRQLNTMPKVCQSEYDVQSVKKTTCTSSFTGGCAWAPFPASAANSSTAAATRQQVLLLLLCCPLGSLPAMLRPPAR
jgi:hypothetical protein